VLLQEVRCEFCRDSTRHRMSILEEIIQRQSVLLPDGRYINFACPECNMLTRSPLRTARLFPEVDLSKFPDDLRLYVVSLQCAEGNCESPVILLAAVKIEIEEADWTMHAQTNWHNHNAACANGHPPKAPLEIRGWMQPPK
jgi:hypothetical protein